MRSYRCKVTISTKVVAQGRPIAYKYISINILGPRVPWAFRQLVSPPPDLRWYCSRYLILDHHFLNFSPFRTKNPRYENCSHFWEKLRFLGGRKNSFFSSKNIFNLCSHIELNTQNPNPILKITICFTKTPKNAKILSKVLKISEKSKKSKMYFVLCIICIIHIL